ncbi:MAG: hypothetical protein IJ207_07545 [Treponema sp.]|uniref:CHASE3 domain-containing protein n=1 Tax=Treponema sp. TaxID=166 RepID=UPI0025D7692F|nr:hypothetical protein [Treponema sp.]MBQ9282040.1 hypothetical protein [Treponema sp.]
MKLSKKILAAFSVAAMLVVAGSFTACKDEDDDDPYEMITKVNSSYYTINHTNTDADTVQRGYKSTSFKHAGALVDITFNSAKSTGTYGDGVMGVIFGLESNDDGSKNFYVFGARNKGDYYVSKYKNVTDLQAANFGAGDGHQFSDENDFTADDNTAEYEIKTFTDAPSGKLKTSADSVSFTVFYKDTVDETETDDGYKHTYKVYLLDANTASAYTVKDGTGDVLDGDKNVVDLDSAAEEIASIDYYTDSKSFTQRQFAIYANVYPNSDNCTETYNKARGTGTVKGYWKVQGDFKHADVVED